MKTTHLVPTVSTRPALPCSLAALIAAHPDGIHYLEKYAVGWLGGESPDMPSKRLQTLAEKHPQTQVVCFGDETIGLEIDGSLWAAEMPHLERGRGKQTRLPHGDWQWLHWAADHKIEDGVGGFINFGDTSELRKAP